MPDSCSRRRQPSSALPNEQRVTLIRTTNIPLQRTRHRHDIAPETSAGSFASERPVLIVTAHYGNWELGSYWPGFLGVKSHVVARPIDNPYIERVIRRFRTGSGATVAVQGNSARGPTTGRPRVVDDSPPVLQAAAVQANA